MTGALELGDAVFLPESVRIAKVTGELGGSAQPGAPVAQATSDTLEVQVDLDASQQGEVKEGDRAQITLPGNTSVTGKVDRLGTSRPGPAGQNDDAGAATIPAYISLDDPEQARGLDKAPVQVEITTEGVESALSVPVTAIVGKSGGGFAVEVVRAGGRRELVAVKLGLFDTAGGRVQVEGDLARRRSRGGAVAVSGESVLELDGVTKVYGEQPPVPALRGVSFSVRRGELVAIVGPSGSGKSTLLHVMGTLERPSSGVVRIGGVDAARLSDRELSRLRAREIGFVFQQFFLAEHATVRENVADGLLYAGVPAAERYRRADEALERVGLAERATFKPTKLSGGERQRVAIARALVGRPAIVLADEPTGNLDSTTGASIMELIRELNAAGATILMITHDAGLADQLPRQIRMLDGQVVSDTARRGAMSAEGGRLRLKDGLRVASVGLRARPLRAALSALGIAIGTAAIVAVLGLSSSSQAGLLAEIDRLGTNLLTVEAGQSLTGGRGEAAPRSAGADHPPGRRPAGGTHRPDEGREGLPELDDPGGQHRWPPGAGHQPEPAVRARHRRRTRQLAQRGHRPRAGRGARLGRRATAGHRPGLPRSADLAGTASGSTSRAS